MNAYPLHLRRPPIEDETLVRAEVETANAERSPLLVDHFSGEIDPADRRVHMRLFERPEAGAGNDNLLGESPVLAGRDRFFLFGCPDLFSLLVEDGRNHGGHGFSRRFVHDPRFHGYQRLGLAGDRRPDISAPWRDMDRPGYVEPNMAIDARSGIIARVGDHACGPRAPPRRSAARRNVSAASGRTRSWNTHTAASQGARR